MDKAFIPFTWENEPSVKSPVSADNLNKMNNAIDTIDNRVIALNTTKADLTELSSLVKDVRIDEATGQIIFTRYNGGTVIIDTLLEKLAINFGYDYTNERLIIYLADGSEQYVDLSKLITQYEFLESDTIVFTVTSDGKVSANIKKGSITGDMLEPNYLAKAQEEANNASASAQSASGYALEAKRWAIGDEVNYPESVADNAKHYAKKAQEAAALAEQTAKANLPSVYVDTETMQLMGKEGTGYQVYLDENGMLWGGIGNG